MDGLSLAIGIAATGLGAWRVVSGLRARVNARLFVGAIVRMIERGDVVRAIKICNAAPNVLLAGAFKAGLLRSRDQGKGIEERRDRIVSAYNRARDEGLNRLQQYSMLGWAAIGLGTLAIISGLLAQPLTLLAVGLGVVGVALALFSFAVVRQLRSDCQMGETSLVESLTRAWRKEGGLLSEGETTLGSAASASPGATESEPEQPVKRVAATDSVDSEDSEAEAKIVVASDSPHHLADMRNGICAICQGGDITEQSEPQRPGFVLHVCRSCGYAQLFARIPSAH